MLKTAATQWIRLALGSLFILLTLFGQAAWAALNVRYQDNIQGGATLFGNSFYLQTNDWDGAYTILRADVDGDPSTSISSSSDLVLPPGATVVKAFLSVETMYGIVVGSADFDSVKFKTPGGSYTTLNTASAGYLTRNIFNDAPGTGSDRYYRQMVFDVTSLLPTTPTGTYTVADPSPRNDNTADVYNQMGGWALTVVYRNPSPTAQFRNITVADNWNFFNAAGEFVNVDIPNVIVPSSGTVNAVVGMTGTYGDPLLTDYVRVGNAAGVLTVLTDPTTGRNNDALDGSIGWAANNNVSADGGPIISGNYMARNPNTGFSTNYSSYYATTVTSAMYDADIFNATGAIPANATPITVRVQQNSDGGDWLISGTYFVSVDLPAATLTKTMSPATVSAGTKTTYTFTIANTAPGNVNLTGLGFTDSLPSALIVASPNGVTLNNCTGASVTAVPGTGSISVGGLSLAAGQSCSVSVDAINKDGFSNEDCASNPAAFTNGSSNINTTSGLLRVGVTAQCLLVTPVDRSDAPAGYGAPTHTIVAGTRLGTTVTTENAAYNSANADGDVDDGITLPTLTQNQTSTITATVAGAGGYLQGWIDWNGDGDFEDAGEQVATNLQDGGALDTNTTAGTIAFDVNVPAGAVTTQTYARFRWSTTSGLNSTASASNGEVEDYALTIKAGHQLSGVVFEDINYGGGAGRNLAAASGVGVNGTTVELYNTAGALVATTTTANNGTQDGAYTFNSVQDGNYYVRVVSDTVSSTRSGTNGAELGVQTFRTDGTTAVTSEVGGHNPAVADGAANSGTQTLDTGTYTLSGGSAVQSLQPVTLTGADVAGVDFGFNFDTIVNTNDTGQGSLRQFILNSNLLGGEASLAQAGSRKRLDNTDEALPASHESSIFMIPTSALTSGVARIAVPSSGSLLPSVTGSKTILDATTQTVNQGDTNSGLLGTGGTVGVDALSLPQIAAPEVELYPAAGGYNYAVHLNAANVVMRGFAAYGFGVDVNSNGIVVVGSAGTGAVIEQNVLGSTASSFTTPALRGDGSNIQTGASGGSVRNNLIGFSRGNGLRMNGSGWTVSGNEIRGNGTGSADGLWGYFGSSMLIQGNLITDSASAGYDGLYRSTFRNNTVTANGRDSSSPEDYGVSVVGDGSVIDLNIFTENLGQAILVYNNVHATTLNNIISRNSLFDNGKLGIDITPTSNTEGNGITLNDANDADTGANAQLNFPQFTKTIVGGSNLTISGCAPAGATIELFEADVSPTSISGIASGANQFGKTQDYGEGETYLSSWVEGIGEDVAPSPINCSTVVDADGNSAAGMSPFQWTIPMPTQLIAGDFITATATLTGAGTSEFSAVSMVVNLDYGDAPSSYDTPSHAITSGLQLGATAPDVETAPQPSATANGDDSNGTDDEDGISNFPDLSTASQTYTLNVVANNTSGSNARLVGWIDFNRDGAFGTDEAATTNVANGSSNQAIGLKWKTLPALQAGDTYLRLRLTTDTSIATGTASTSQSDGAANDGEVEDYMLTIANGGFTIRGTLFHDNNVDSVKNGAEKGIKDVVMVLYDTANGTCRSTKTGADGSYQFSAVQPAAANNYVVYEAAGEKIQTPTACPPAANDPSGFLSTTANSQTLTVSNANVSGIDFGDVQQPLFELDNQKTILPGTTVAYPHTFRTPADGVVDFSLATAADPSQLAWGTQLYLDNNCDAKLGSGDTVVDSPLALLAGDKLCLLVKVLAPTNASAGATHTVEVSSTFTFGDGSSGLADVVQTHSDITTTLSGTSPEPVGGEGKLSLTKSVWNVTRNIDGAVALPGETLRYTIAYENIGNGNVVELVINDTVPEFTQLVPGSLLCTNRPAGLPACAANSSADGSLDWTWAAGDKLAPGAHGSVSYEVVVE